MSKISFNPQALSIGASQKNRNVGRPVIGCAFEPVVVDKPGIEAIFEGLRLANLRCFPTKRTKTTKID